MCGTTEYTCEGSSSFKERLPGVQSPQRISEVRRPHWAGKLTLKKAMTSAGLSEFSFSWNTSFNVENRVLSSMTFSQVGSLSTVGRRDSRGMTAIKTLVVRYAVIPSSQENDLSEMDESPETTRRMWPFWEASSSICGCSHQMVWLARSDVSPCSLLPFMKQQLGKFFSIDVFTLCLAELTSGLQSYLLEEIFLIKAENWNKLQAFLSSLLVNGCHFTQIIFSL